MGNPSRTVEVPDFVAGERVGLGPDHNNPGHILEIEGVRAKVRFGYHPKEYRNWYGLDELVALPTVKVGDRVGYKSANDPNPGTVVEVIHSRAIVEWDRPLIGGTTTNMQSCDDLVVLPELTFVDHISKLFDDILASGPAGVSEAVSNAAASCDCGVAADEPLPHIVVVIENGQPKPAEEPVFHPNYSAAAAEANRLAKKLPGQEFAVFSLVGAARTEIVAQQVA